MIDVPSRIAWRERIAAAKPFGCGAALVPGFGIAAHHVPPDHCLGIPLHDRHSGHERAGDGITDIVVGTGRVVDDILPAASRRGVQGAKTARRSGEDRASRPGR